MDTYGGGGGGVDLEEGEAKLQQQRQSDVDVIDSDSEVVVEERERGGATVVVGEEENRQSSIIAADHLHQSSPSSTGEHEPEYEEVIVPTPVPWRKLFVIGSLMMADSLSLAMLWPFVTLMVKSKLTLTPQSFNKYFVLIDALMRRLQHRRR